MPTRREFIGGLATFGAVAAMPSLLFGATSTAPSKPLNLLIITADDLNCDSCGWMGNPVGATPNLDAFSKTANCFAHAHSSAPICQPSREAIMTGRVPHRSGALGFDPVNGDVPTLVEVLKASGYFTAGIHKLSHMAPPAKFNWDARYDGGKKNREESGREPALYKTEVADAIARADSAHKPFFINCNINYPHRPFYDTAGDVKLNGAKLEHELAEKDVVIPGFLDDLPDVRKEVTQYFNSVKRFDQSFGQVMSALETSGRADSTIVVFLSDHGMSFPYAKTTIYQNGTRTPLMIRAPRVSQPSIDRDHMVSNTDVMPSVLELLGVSAPPGMDGRSLVPILRGTKQDHRDHVFTHMNSQVQRLAFPSRCVRTKNSAYIFNAWSDGKTRFKNESQGGLTFKAMQKAGQSDEKIAARCEMFLHRRPEEFYDLKNDPHERTNVFSAAEHREEIARLKHILLDQMRATNDPLFKDFEKVV
jgi:N-sulfoglucosamine sulfohydrolase